MIEPLRQCSASYGELRSAMEACIAAKLVVFVKPAPVGGGGLVWLVRVGGGVHDKLHISSANW